QYYPYPKTLYSSSSHSQSTGSFVPVFIVLAAILFVSVLSCVVGRACDRCSHRGGIKRSDPGGYKDDWGSRPNPSISHVKGNGDLERGSGAKIQPAGEKPAAVPPQNIVGFVPRVRFADN
ncbi:hypothetical protein M569_02782, partial [Genlisea aurea]